MNETVSDQQYLYIVRDLIEELKDKLEREAEHQIRIGTSDQGPSGRYLMLAHAELWLDTKRRMLES